MSTAVSTRDRACPYCLHVFETVEARDAHVPCPSGASDTGLPTSAGEYAAWVDEASTHTHAADCGCPLCCSLPDGRLVATWRDEHDPCERGTVGCCVQHEPAEDGGCETW